MTIKVPMPKTLCRSRLTYNGEFCALGHILHHGLKVPIEKMRSNRVYGKASYLFIAEKLGVDWVPFYSWMCANDGAASREERLDLFRERAAKCGIEVID